ATVAFRKGQHLLVEAFSKIAADYPGWRLRIVGTLAEAACIERIQETIKRHHLEDRVELHGSDPDPSRHFEECEIYVQPSLLEGLGLSLQEAMFHGRACVGARAGGIPELIHDPSVGLLYDSSRVDELAARLVQFMDDAELRTRTGAAARASILTRGMTRQSMAENYRSLYQQALSRSR
ncbi:MAG: glycosyltransferase, partial [Verrucomicrobiaceae bacterium]